MRRIAYAIAMVASAAALLLPAAANASGTVDVSIANFKIKPATTSTKAGKTTFVVKNSDAMTHELVIIKTTKKAGDLPMKGDVASETGKVGEVSDLAGGKTGKVTVNLTKGHYALICNIPGHYKGGMYADFTVK
jgi:uncharacterized cupredoxin-like copper-binding protein